MESSKILKTEITESEELTEPEIVDVDKFIVEVLKNCDCSTAAKYFKGIQKDQFLRFTLLEIDRLLPGHLLSSSLSSCIVSTTSLKIYDEITKVVRSVSVPRHKVKLTILTDPDYTFTSIPFSNNSSDRSIFYANCQTDAAQGLSMFFAPKMKLVDSNSDSIEFEGEDDEPQRKRLCNDWQATDLIKEVSLSTASLPLCSNGNGEVIVVAELPKQPCEEDKTIKLVVLSDDEDEKGELQNRISLYPFRKTIQKHSSKLGEQVASVKLALIDQNDDVITKGNKLQPVVSNTLAKDKDDEVVILTEKSGLHRSKNWEVVDLATTLNDDDTDTEPSLPTNAAQANPSTSSLTSAVSTFTPRDALLLQERFLCVETDADVFVEVSEPKIHTERLAKYGNIYAEQVCTKISLLLQEQVISCRDSSNHLSPQYVTEWTEFYKNFGKTITSLKLNVWSWNYLCSNCPFNLFKMLQQNCPSIQELIINSGPHDVHLDFTKAASRGGLLFQIRNLLELKKIAIHVNDPKSKKVPALILQKILEASPNLEELSYEFRSREHARKVLATLSSFDSLFLENMKILRIMFAHDCMHHYLSATKMKPLLAIPANNLIEIVLHFNIMIKNVVGAKDYIGRFFQSFPLVKKFVWYGLYCGIGDDPDILIKIPASEHLEHLEIGMLPTFESTPEQHNMHTPSEDQLQCLQIIRSHDSKPEKPHPLNTNLGKESVKDLDRVKSDFYCNVAIPYLMPKLKTIILDDLYDLEDLHFNSIPKISTFRVDSKWHLVTKFSSVSSRRSCFSFLTDFQVPSRLQDDSFILNFPQRFPNITKCWISIPAVNVLRAFFKTMADSKLDTLILKTGFYFESTFEICFFAQRGMMRTTSQFTNDQNKWNDLRQYKHFHEFVDRYDVEAPCWETIDELCDCEKYAGLSALKNLKTLKINHDREVLRIPKGDEHWSSSSADFTDACIGFNNYPLSRTFMDQLPSWVQYYEWSYFEIERPVRDNNSNDEDIEDTAGTETGST